MAFISLGSYHVNAQESEDGIKFFKGTWEEVIQESIKENKPIFVDAYTVWCGPCRWMNANVFPVKEVGDFFNENYISYKFDMEKGEGPLFAKKYQINAYPTLLFLDSEGKVKHRLVGGRKSDMLIDDGTVALKKLH